MFVFFKFDLFLKYFENFFCFCDDLQEGNSVGELSNSPDF